MKRGSLVLLVVAACGGRAAGASAVAPATPATSAAPGSATPGSATSANSASSPAGVTIVVDQLYAAASDPKVKDKSVPYADRVAAVRAILGVQGEPVNDPLAAGTGFLAIGGATEEGPWSCHELVVAERGPTWLVRDASSARCGLPDPKEARGSRARAPHTTVFRLRELAAKVQGKDPLEAELAVRNEIGFPVPGRPRPTWFGIGPRTAEAPFSCYALTIGEKPEVTEMALADCGYIWRPRP